MKEKPFVLFFDRNKDFADTYRNLINVLGYETQSCYSPDDILRINDELEKNMKYIDAAFLNLCPELESGNWEILDRLRIRNPLIKIFAISSNEFHPIMRDPRPFFNGSIIKPFSGQVLEVILEQVVFDVEVVK